MPHLLGMQVVPCSLLFLDFHLSSTQGLFQITNYKICARFEKRYCDTSRSHAAVADDPGSGIRSDPSLEFVVGVIAAYLNERALKRQFCVSCVQSFCNGPTAVSAAWIVLKGKSSESGASRRGTAS